MISRKISTFFFIFAEEDDDDDDIDDEDDQPSTKRQKVEDEANDWFHEKFSKKTHNHTKNWKQQICSFSNVLLSKDCIKCPSHLKKKKILKWNALKNLNVAFVWQKSLIGL